MGDRTRDDVTTERVNVGTGRRVVDARDRRRRTREGGGLRTGPKTITDLPPDAEGETSLPDDSDS